MALRASPRRRALLVLDLGDQLGRAGPDHAVATVTGLGWSRTKNSELVRRAAAAGFEALVTVDVGQQVAPDALLPLMPSVLEHLSRLQPGRTELIATKPPA